MKHTYKWLIITIVVILISILLFWYLPSFISSDDIFAQKEYLRLFVQNNYWKSVFYFILFYTLLTATGLPITAPFALLGGYLFNIFPGALYTQLSSTLGAFTLFLIVRYLITNNKISIDRQRLERFKEQIKKYGVSNTMLMLQFMAIVPFMLINIFAAVVQVPIPTFLWTTTLGTLPLIIVYSVAGKKLATLNTVSDIFSLPIILMFAGLIALGVLPIIIKYIKNRRLNNHTGGRS